MSAQLKLTQSESGYRASLSQSYGIEVPRPRKMSSFTKGFLFALLAFFVYSGMNSLDHWITGGLVRPPLSPMHTIERPQPDAKSADTSLSR